MADSNGGGGSPEPQAAEAEGRFEIQKIYCKDLSFENPRAPEIFRGEWQPDVDVQIQSTATAIGSDLHDVVLAVTVTVKVGDETAFLAEVHQAGIFAIDGLDREQLGHVLGSYCPSILYPYAREAISDVVTRGGFPQLVLVPANFDAMYEQQRELERANPAGSASN